MQRSRGKKEKRWVISILMCCSNSIYCCRFASDLCAERYGRVFLRLCKCYGNGTGRGNFFLGVEEAVFVVLGCVFTFSNCTYLSNAKTTIFIRNPGIIENIRENFKKTALKS